jgi:hypothetical protein
MCYELCGPQIANALADYDAWLRDEGPYAPEEVSEEEDDTPTKISESDALQRFDEMLDEIHETVKCGKLEWDMSRVLKEMDPTAYRCGFSDWLDSEGLELE